MNIENVSGVIFFVQLPDWSRTFIHQWFKFEKFLLMVFEGGWAFVHTDSARRLFSCTKLVLVIVFQFWLVSARLILV